MLKGLPLAYNRDLQEDKPPLFDAADTVKGCLAVLAAMLPRLAHRRRPHGAAAADGFLLATDVADYLVTQGRAVPRGARRSSAALVRHCLAREPPLESLDATRVAGALARTSSPTSRDWLSLDAALARRVAGGGTAPANVARRLRGL